MHLAPQTDKLDEAQRSLAHTHTTLLLANACTHSPVTRTRHAQSCWLHHCALMSAETARWWRSLTDLAKQR